MRKNLHGNVIINITIDISTKTKMKKKKTFQTSLHMVITAIGLLL